MDNHFNNDETRRVPLPGSESPVPEQFTPEHFDDDREPEQPQKQPKRRRSRRQMNAGCAGSMVYMIAVVGVSLVLSIAALFMANDIFAFVKADAVKEITVSENTSVSSLAKELDDQGVINYHSVFKLYLTLKHQTDTSVLAGAYQLNPSMDYGQIVDALANTASTETVQITIPEGYSISQIRQVLLDNHICTEDALDEVLNDYSFKHDFLEDEKPAAEGWLEGYLFPDTYEVYKSNAAVVDTINKMLNNFGNKYDADIKSGAENLGRSMHDIVTIASLIEREAQRDDERARIAGVIYNRLNNSSEFPYLQVDASVLYGLGRTGGKLSDEDLKSDSEYNLYNHEGLPPGPICNPGYASLYAASHPEDNNYYYYVAMPDGSHLFASSYEEHERNIEASNQAQAQAASASADTTTTEATGE